MFYDVDSTLIDYIIVMVVNQKSKFEMKHNLSLFLGKIVDEFVNWLFDYLSNANELEAKNTTASGVDKSPKQVKGKWWLLIFWTNVLISPF